MGQTTVTTSFFNSFSALPFALTLYDATPSDPTRLLFSSDPITFPDNNFFAFPPTLLPEFLRNTIYDKHTLLIEERFTSFEIVDLALNNKANLPIVFSYYEDSDNYERAFVKADFLGACLHKTLYQYIQQLHGPRVIYVSLKFDSFEKQSWVGDSVCKKGNSALPVFESQEVAFKLIQVSKNQNDYVNFKTNLMFTSKFDNTVSNFYKPNCFGTCSAFMTQNYVANLQYQGLFADLESAFVEEIILSDLPLIKLIPCFERGTIVQTAKKVYFKGLVSNAGGSVEPSP